MSEVKKRKEKLHQTVKSIKSMTVVEGYVFRE